MADHNITEIITALTEVLKTSGVKFVSTTSAMQIDLKPYPSNMPAAVIVWDNAKDNNKYQCRYTKIKEIVGIEVFTQAETNTIPLLQILSQRDEIKRAIRSNKKLVYNGKETCISCEVYGSSEPNLAEKAGKISQISLILEITYEQSR